MTTHPVVQKYDLKTYTSKYDSQRCAISGKDIPKGTLIANITSLMPTFNALGVFTTRVFKYASVELLPMLASIEEMEFIKAAADRLLGLTDPQWPKDQIGCSSSSYWPLQTWADINYNELGTQRVARALMQHVGTQIDEDSAEAEAIKKVAARKWTETTPHKAPVEEDVICDEGYIIRETRRVGEVFVDTLNSTTAIVVLDPPWNNTYHAEVKDSIKAVGAKWDRSSKDWTISFSSLADVLTRFPTTVLTPAALNALRNMGEAYAKENKTVTLNGRSARVQTSPSRKRGEVLLDLDGSGLKVMFDFPKTDRMLQLKDDVKRLSGRWNKDNKCWVLGTNAVVENIEILFQDLPLVLTEAAVKAMTAVMERRSLSTATDLNDDELKKAINDSVPAGKKLFPFQAAGVAFLEKAGGCGLVGDEMGTGKTIQTAAFLDYRPDLRPAVVVVPAVVTTNWVHELEDWTEGESIYRIKNRKDVAPEGTTIVVVTYDLVKQVLTKEEKKEGEKKVGAREALKAMNPKCIVIDECHYLKNEKAQRTIACKDLASPTSVESVVLLSGTPIVNRPKEFFTALSMLRPEEFSSWFKYTERYCDGHRDDWDRYQCDGVSNTEELASKLKDVMIRRLKKDVLEELPAKMRGRVTVDITPKTRAAYNRAMKNADTPLTQITAGRHALGLAKVAPALELANEYADQNKPLLLFAHHHEVMDGLCEGLVASGISYGRIDGTVSVERRGKLVEMFQAGKLDAMVLSVKAAGVGITLTHSSDVLFVERAWTPADEEQAEDRTHRIGQTGSVVVRYMVATNTMDEDMDALINSKRVVLEAILNQGKLLPENLDIRKELLAAVAKRVVGKRKKGAKQNVRKRA